MARLNHDIEPESAGGEGQDRRNIRPGLVRRLFHGEDPLSLAFPIARIGPLRLRIHWVVPVYIASELAASLPQDRIGLPYVAIALGALAVVVLLREIGRGFFARWLGSSVDQVVLWPLGGLNAAAKHGTPQPVAAETGGLIVGALLAPVLALAAVQAGVDKENLLFNPFRPSEVLSYGTWTTVQLALWFGYYLNIVVLGLNLLLPMFPMDLGRIMAARWRRHSPAFLATERAGRVGLIAAVTLFILAATVGENRLMAVAFCCFVATLIELRRAQFLAPAPSETPEEPPPARAHPAKPKIIVVPDPELDVVLAKISREGMASLNPTERAVLTRETERRRRG
jgi:Zn-dependent protease